MKICQNPECREEISRETALFCPYCGRYQNPTGWHHHQKALSAKINAAAPFNSKICTAHVFDLKTAVRDCLVEGHVLVVLNDQTVAAYNLHASINQGNAEELWHQPIRGEAKIVILRPYVIIIERNYICCAHLDTGYILNLPELAEEQDLAHLRDSLVALPLENNQKNKRSASLVFAADRALTFLKFNARNQFAGYTTQSPGFNSPILTLHRDDADDDALFVYSKSGERARLRLSECLNESDAKQMFISKDDVYMKGNKPAGGYQIEWAYTRNGVAYFLERKTNGNTMLYKTGKEAPEVISSKIFTKKLHSDGQEQPLLLFELSEFKNQLQAYDLRNRSVREFDLNAPKYFNIEHERFEMFPERLLYFAEKYWALCPGLRPAKAYHLISMDFAEGRELKVETHLYIPMEGLNQALGTFEMLPMLLNERQIVSYNGNKVIVIS